MAKLIEGEGLEQEVTAAAEIPTEDFGLGRYIKSAGLQKAYDRYSIQYVGWAKQERVLDLQNRLSEIARIHGSLTDSSRKSLGYLTTILALEKYGGEERVEIESLDFIEELGLKSVSYLFAGAYRFDVGNVEVFGEHAFYQMDDCTFEAVGAADYFGAEGSNSTIQHLEEGGSWVLRESKGVTVDRVDGEFPNFGSDSSDMKIGFAVTSGGEFGARSKDMHVREARIKGKKNFMRAVDSVIDFLYTEDSAFGCHSIGLKVKGIERVGHRCGYKAKDMEIGKIKTAWKELLHSSENCKIEYIQWAGEKMGFKSNGLTIDTINETEDSFGEDSFEMNVRVAGKLGNGAAVGSIGFTSEQIEEVGEQFGVDSKNLDVKHIGRVYFGDFLTESENATVGFAGGMDFEMGEGAKGYLVFDEAGNAHSNRNFSVVAEIMEQRGGELISEVALNLLGEMEEDDA